MVRAKFIVTETRKNYFNNGGTTIFLEPRYDDSIPEDRRFHDATPSGRLEMYVNNPKAIEALQLGKQFYLDFTPAEG